MAAGTVSEPSGYRQDNYRAPVPATLSGARVVDTDEAARRWRDKSAVFVDVLPRAPKPKNLPEGTVWRDPVRADIPGSVWLPNVGFGTLSPAMEDYFRTELQRVTAGELSRPLLFYCLANCWMSWNAAKRALSLGYGNVLWYPEGTDAWEKQGLPLEPRTPVEPPAS